MCTHVGVREFRENFATFLESDALKCDIWTEDADFFGTGVATWTTSRVEIFLKQKLQSLEQDEA